MPTANELLVASAKDEVRSALQRRYTQEAKVASAANEQRPTQAPRYDLASLVGTEIAYLRADDRLEDIFSVDRHRLPPEIQEIASKQGLGRIIQPFALDLLNYVERRIADKRERLRSAAFIPPPNSEDEWIARIMGMTVAEFDAALA